MPSDHLTYDGRHRKFVSLMMNHQLLIIFGVASFALSLMLLFAALIFGNTA